MTAERWICWRKRSRLWKAGEGGNPTMGPVARRNHLKTFVGLTLLSFLYMVSSGSGSAHATLSAHLQRGSKLVEISVPGRAAEVCVVPRHFPNGAYSERDLKTEGQLCAIDENANAAVCPKLNSTNPGLDVYSFAQGSTPRQVQAARCKTAGASKIAKYKLSTSCSYTPSILSYYHLSRILGGIANVPPSTLRTFDLQNHIALGRTALAQVSPNTLIHQTWTALMAQLTAGANGSRRDLLLTDDFTQSYGALSLNPSHEQFYREFFNGGTNNVARAVNFRDKNPIVALLARNVDISTLVGRSFTTENVQKMVQLRDASDMIIIDTLLNQQDRFGNIHYVETYYYQDIKDLDSDRSPKLKSNSTFTSAQAAQVSAVQVKEMLLKDNDCGVDKHNVARQAGLSDRIAHIDPDVYGRLLQFDAAADSPETREFFIRELVFSSNDYVNVRQNLRELSARLHQACAQGKLKPDLDLQAHFSTKALKVPSCD
jgi:hypothetical protein